MSKGGGAANSLGSQAGAWEPDLGEGMNEVVETTGPLSTEETKVLRECEGLIRRHFWAFTEVGRALARIRDEGLYRGTHGTFEAYVRDRWDISRARAYELIGAEVVVKNLSGMPDIRLPANVRQAQPLTVLEPAEQRQAWAQVVASAPGGQITARHVAAVVKDLLVGLGKAVGGSGSGGGRQPDELSELLARIRKALEALTEKPERADVRERVIARLEALVEELSELAETQE